MTGSCGSSTVGRIRAGQHFLVKLRQNDKNFPHFALLIGWLVATAGRNAAMRRETAAAALAVTGSLKLSSRCSSGRKKRNDFHFALRLLPGRTCTRKTSCGFIFLLLRPRSHNLPSILIVLERPLKKKSEKPKTNVEACFSETRRCFQRTIWIEVPFRVQARRRLQ